MIRGVHHLAIQVADLARMERFYTEVVGLPVLRRWPASSGGERAVWLDLGAGAFLALEVVPDVPPADPEGRPGYFLLALQIPVAERLAWASRLAAAGHAVYHRSPFTLYVRDPEGNRLGFSHYPDPAPGDDRAEHHV